MRTYVRPILCLHFFPEGTLEAFAASRLLKGFYWMIRVNRAGGESHQSCQQQARGDGPHIEAILNQLASLGHSLAQMAWRLRCAAVDPAP